MLTSKTLKIYWKAQTKRYTGEFKDLEELKRICIEAFELKDISALYIVHEDNDVLIKSDDELSEALSKVNSNFVKIIVETDPEPDNEEYRKEMRKRYASLNSNKCENMEETRIRAISVDWECDLNEKPIIEAVETEKKEACNLEDIKKSIVKSVVNVLENDLINKLDNKIEAKILSAVDAINRGFSEKMESINRVIEILESNRFRDNNNGMVMNDNNTIYNSQIYPCKTQMNFEKESLYNFEIRESKIYKDTQNNVRLDDSVIDFVEVNNKPKNNLEELDFNDNCSICSCNVYEVKYLCCVCKNLVLCKSCELIHQHPVIKCKNTQLDSYLDIFKVMLRNEKHQSKNIFDGLFDTKAKLSIKTISANPSMRRNSVLRIPISIMNLSNKTIPENELHVIVKGNKDLQVEQPTISKCLIPKQEIELYLTCRSGDVEKCYDLEIFLISKEMKIEGDSLRVLVQVNNDPEDSFMNEKLQNYPRLIVLPKYEKHLVLKMIEEGRSVKHPYIVYNMLKRNKFKLFDDFDNQNENQN